MSLQLKAICISLALLSYCYVHGSAADSDNVDSDEVDQDYSNETVPQDLYVIKTVVYEVGILTNAGNDTDGNNTESHEEVALSIYDPSHNGSVIDLSTIPLPIQTNVSGVEVTGILPSNLRSLLLPTNGTSSPLNTTLPFIPNKQIKVTQNISTTDPTKGGQIISNLSQLFGLHSPLAKTENTTKNNDNN